MIGADCFMAVSASTEDALPAGGVHKIGLTVTCLMVTA